MIDAEPINAIEAQYPRQNRSSVPVFAMHGNSQRSRDSALQVRFCHTRSVLLVDRHTSAT